MRGQRVFQARPFLGCGNPIPFIVGIRLGRMRGRVVGDQSKLRTPCDIKHVGERHVVVVHRLHIDRKSRILLLPAAGLARRSGDDRVTVAARDPLVLNSLSPICGHIFGCNRPQRLIAKKPDQISQFGK